MLYYGYNHREDIKEFFKNLWTREDNTGGIISISEILKELRDQQMQEMTNRTTPPNPEIINGIIDNTKELKWKRLRDMVDQFTVLKEDLGHKPTQIEIQILLGEGWRREYRDLREFYHQNANVPQPSNDVLQSSADNIASGSGSAQTTGGDNIASGSGSAQTTSADITPKPTPQQLPPVSSGNEPRIPDRPSQAATPVPLPGEQPPPFPAGPETPPTGPVQPPISDPAPSVPGAYSSNTSFPSSSGGASSPADTQPISNVRSAPGMKRKSSIPLKEESVFLDPHPKIN